MTEKVQIKDATLYLGDCAEVLSQIDAADALITDPPYGIGASSGVGKYGVHKWGGKNDLKWDEEAPDRTMLNALLTSAKHHIIWGGNYFALPPSRCFLVWDKGAGFRNRTFAEAELAWSSLDRNAKVFSRDPLAAGDYRGKEHPTQKPLALMKWCLQLLPAGCRTILDPYMGSGTTGVACVQMGKRFIGMEREPEYFEIACRRISEAYDQPDIFVIPVSPESAKPADLFSYTAA